MRQVVLKAFPGLKIERPLFYSWPIGIRFEIGPENISLWKNREKRVLNDEYFEVAAERATSIFDAVFEKNDEISIITQKFSDGRKKIRKGDFVFKKISNVETKTVEFSDVKDIYELEFKSHCFKRVCISGIHVKDVEYRNILTSLINTDFSTRSPSSKSECFFINQDKGIMLNLYDDRGMDVIASSVSSLKELYISHNHWILNYDRNQIDETFT